MRVALVEMTSVPELDKNIETIISSIETASKNKADMVLFPENCSCLAPSKIMLKYASVDQDHPVLKAAITAAKTNRIYVLLGSIAVFPNYKIRDKLQNRSLLIDKKGNVVSKSLDVLKPPPSEKESNRLSFWAFLMGCVPLAHTPQPEL